jgi:lipoprotein-anchoring transpeptidase ErfK/SrfK
MENEEKKPRPLLNVFVWIVPLFLLILILGMIGYTPLFQNGIYKVKSLFSGSIIGRNNSFSSSGSAERKLRQSIVLLEGRLDKLKPVKPYIVVNTTENRFSLRDVSGDTIKTGVCSTGKNELLIAGPKRIVFKTPKGMFTVKNKQQSRPWVKPDWAFIEEGLPVPSARSAERIDYNTLGDYALEIGDGYMLHGTLYQRFLGLPVTHGCVRLGDKDLELIYNTLTKGSKVFIY